MKFTTLSILLLSAMLCAAASKQTEYSTGTLLSWSHGAVNCSKAFGETNCNPGGDTVYRVSGEGMEYTLIRDTSGQGLLDKHADPLRKLLPKAQFKYRFDSKQRFIVMWEKDGKQHETRYKIVQGAEASSRH